jgi:hypothetical protein
MCPQSHATVPWDSHRRPRNRCSLSVMRSILRLHPQVRSRSFPRHGSRQPAVADSLGHWSLSLTPLSTCPASNDVSQLFLCEDRRPALEDSIVVVGCHRKGTRYGEKNDGTSAVRIVSRISSISCVCVCVCVWFFLFRLEDVGSGALDCVGSKCCSKKEFSRKISLRPRW